MHKNRPLKPLISLLFLQFFGHEKQTNAQGLLMYVICFVPIPVHLRECLNLTRKSSKNSFSFIQRSFSAASDKFHRSRCPHRSLFNSRNQSEKSSLSE